ncbi:Six-hairpin glycosidase-like protein [Cadophora sp. MPI-SDFR-AT-0126]|nr:Six-hairpin glycosidase-like protein [Leotiomycetes sp. MPI-SDFR-AT-0126]
MAQLDVHVRVVDNGLGAGSTSLKSINLKEPALVGISEKSEEATRTVLERPPQSKCLGIELQELFSENILAKAWRVANRDLQNNNLPTAYPEFVPQSGSGRGRYTLREADFWTCGFFPGTLYSLLERISRYPHAVPFLTGNRPNQREEELRDLKLSSGDLLSLCRTWAEPLHAMTGRTDTHDLGFIVEPALRLDWELTGNKRSLDSLITAANSLATRYDEKVGAIRSWDLINKVDLKIISMEENFIVIIDSLCNLDLLFYASARSESDRLALIAKQHAKTLLHTHLRPESQSATSRTGYKGQLYSTCHVANIDPRTGEVKGRMTAQGYANNSTWGRGQAWAILGYAQTYMWTKDDAFLDAACGLAEYFLQRLGSSHEVPWDFDAPVDDPENPVMDSSAGAIAANGMLLIAEGLTANQQPALSKCFQDSAMQVVKNLLTYSFAEERARFAMASGPTKSDNADGLTVEDVIPGQSFDAVLKNATANNNVGANRRYWNHGLVYADYYLVRFGNELLRMGLA